MLDRRGGVGWPCPLCERRNSICLAAACEADQRQEDDAEIDGDGGEQGEEGLVVEHEAIAALDVQANCAGKPADEAEEGRTRRLGAFEEDEFGRGDIFHGAQLGSRRGDLFVEHDIPAVTWVAGACRIVTARPRWIRAHFLGQLDQAAGECFGVQSTQVVCGCGEGARILVQAGEQRAPLGGWKARGHRKLLERGAFGCRHGGRGWRRCALHQCIDLALEPQPLVRDGPDPGCAHFIASISRTIGKLKAAAYQRTFAGD